MASHLDKDPHSDDSKERWLEDDARLFLKIRNSIDGKVLTLINHYEFVKEPMEYLEFVYSGKGNISRIFYVCRISYHTEKQAQYEKMVVMGFLASLPSEYDSVKAQILSIPEISSFQETLSRILRTETSSSTPPSTQMSSALVGLNSGESEKQQYKNRGLSGNSKGTSSGGVVCYYCHKPGHVI